MTDGKSPRAVRMYSVKKRNDSAASGATTRCNCWCEMRWRPISAMKRKLMRASRQQYMLMPVYATASSAKKEPRKIRYILLQFGSCLSVSAATDTHRRLHTGARTAVIDGVVAMRYAHKIMSAILMPRQTPMTKVARWYLRCSVARQRTHTTHTHTQRGSFACLELDRLHDIIAFVVVRVKRLHKQIIHALFLQGARARVR